MKVFVYGVYYDKPKSHYASSYHIMGRGMGQNHAVPRLFLEEDLLEFLLEGHKPTNWQLPVLGNQR